MLIKRVQSIFVMLLAIFILAGINQNVEAAHTQRILIYNNTGKTITTINCWTGNVTPKKLNSYNVQNGASYPILIDPSYRNWNLRVYLSNGQNWTWRNRNFSGVSNVWLYTDSDGDVCRVS